MRVTATQVLDYLVDKEVLEIEKDDAGVYKKKAFESAYRNVIYRISGHRLRREGEPSWRIKALAAPLGDFSSGRLISTGLYNTTLALRNLSYWYTNIR
jgi:hypothetical protein